MYSNDCNCCKHRRDTLQRRRLIKHKQRKDYMTALKEGIESGKVVRFTHRDEFTGYCYRVNDRSGDWIILGNGYNKGAS